MKSPRVKANHPGNTTSASKAQIIATSMVESLAPSSATINTTDYAQNDKFSVIFFDQGCPVPSKKFAYTTSLNVTCPYHAAILCLQLPCSTPEGVHSISYAEHKLLSNMPPAGFTHQCRVGTSASCRCTCGQVERYDLQTFSEEVNEIARNSSQNTRASITSRTKAEEVHQQTWSCSNFLKMDSAS
jgi:hypothetical protein